MKGGHNGKKITIACQRSGLGVALARARDAHIIAMEVQVKLILFRIIPFYTVTVIKKIVICQAGAVLEHTSCAPNAEVHFSMHYFSNNLAACRQLLHLYGFYISRHWSDVLF